ncbi:DUF192 domain-containing protein [Rhodophyticola sp. CCM32]|uniref:DUF192 domain-containing protein n=1 Tax=Rhodophyticola sp. CCM32 TaxID=2916397 RepID=UPI00107F5C75|nr:DUF192 domain-containing protein [Rhodophyticola sp. CCM32]QBY00475.1 DUF192 domain-containing protein [Rhodophyticola sp. CCM32]
MRIVAALLAFVFSAGVLLADCRPDQVELRGAFGKARFLVELADTPRERAVGLMHRESMAATAGMIFIYEQPQAVSFWMENTLIPLDMIFIDQSGTVARIHENAIPLDRTPIPGGADILAVLEINGGLAAQIGLAAGDVLRHPGLPQDLAVWPCAAD